MIKWTLRLVTFPLIVTLYVLVWFAVYIIHYFGMLCRFISGVIFFWVVVGFLTGLGSGDHLAKMLAVGLAVYVIPQIGRTMVNAIFPNITP